jgi:ribosomal protein L28
MARICADCGKTTVLGHSKKHRRGVAGKRWKNRVTPTPRLFRANIQNFTVVENGKRVRIKLCTKCMKRRRRDAGIRFASI